jgi:hypothetical protein
MVRSLLDGLWRNFEKRAEKLSIASRYATIGVVRTFRACVPPWSPMTLPVMKLK